MQTAVRDASRPSGFLSPEDLNRAVPQFPAVLAYDILRLRGVPREKQLRGGLRAGSA
jgi:hypothetical protein